MDITQQAYNSERQLHWDRVADQLESWQGWGGYYQQRIRKIYQFNIPQNQRVLEIGCGSGDLLAALKPSYGLGLDISPKMIARARKMHPGLEFQPMDAANLNDQEGFDAVVISDTINDMWDVQSTFAQIRSVIKPDGRLVLNFYSRLWELPLKIASALHIAKPTLMQNWLTVEDTTNLLNLEGFEVIRCSEEVLFPLPVPLIAPLCNRFLVRLWPFYLFAMTHFMIARPIPSQTRETVKPSVSVVIPARNEAGNIHSIFERLPAMGSRTELVFVEGHSRDDTYQEIQAQIKSHPQVPAQIFRQTGKGKGDAVRLGFDRASGDILMILDADLTVPPEDLPRFYNALADHKGDFINGVRLVYPMEKRAMRLFNFLGNKAFSMIFSYLLGQPIKDTLCGTKVLWKKDYLKVAENRGYFGEFDPFGDFDLIFGAAKLNLKIVDMPIRYRERTYGETNIQRWKHGWLLLRMVLFAARRIKFV